MNRKVYIFSLHAVENDNHLFSKEKKKKKRERRAYLEVCVFLALCRLSFFCMYVVVTKSPFYLFSCVVTRPYVTLFGRQDLKL